MLSFVNTCICAQMTNYSLCVSGVNHMCLSFLYNTSFHLKGGHLFCTPMSRKCLQPGSNYM